MTTVLYPSVSDWQGNVKRAPVFAGISVAAFSTMRGNIFENLRYASIVVYGIYYFSLAGVMDETP